MDKITQLFEQEKQDKLAQLLSLNSSIEDAKQSLDSIKKEEVLLNESIAKRQLESEKSFAELSKDKETLGTYIATVTQALNLAMSVVNETQAVFRNGENSLKTVLEQASEISKANKNILTSNSDVVELSNKLVAKVDITINSLNEKMALVDSIKSREESALQKESENKKKEMELAEKTETVQKIIGQITK